MGETKRCCGCKQIKLVSEFHRCKGTKGGYSDYCKLCSKLVWQRWYDKKYPHLKDRREERKGLHEQGLRRCTKCSVVKSLSDFYKKKYCRGGFSSWCKQCEQVADKEYKQSKEWKSWYKEYVKSERGQVVRKGSVSRYSKTEKYRLSCSKRKARKKNLIGDLILEDWLFILNFFDNKCAYCGATSENLEQDHVIPVARGGGYTFSNIVPACLPCNRGKNNREVRAWMIKWGHDWEGFELKWKAIQQRTVGD